MCYSDPTLLAVLILLIGLLSSFILARRGFKNSAASLEVKSDSQWKLGFIAAPKKRYRLCLKFDIRFKGGEDNYGLAVNYRCTALGATISEETAGIGRVEPPHRDRTVKTVYNSSSTATPGQSRHKAVLTIVTLGPFTEPTEVVACGKVLTDPDSRLEYGEVFFA